MRLMLSLWWARGLLCRLLVASVLLAMSLIAGRRLSEDAIPQPLVLSPRAGCHLHGGLPDRRCTPGAVRHGVSLQMLCAYGYTRSVRPPESYTEPLKLRQMRAYHLPGPPSDYEEDHLVPLSIGGAPNSPANLWPEPRHGRHDALEKDQLETWAARAACARRLPLTRLQHDMARDWRALFRAAGGETVLRGYPPGG